MHETPTTMPRWPLRRDAKPQTVLVYGKALQQSMRGYIATYERSTTRAYNHQMISREPTIERLAIARQLLLEPFGLDESHLTRALAEIRAHQVDDADLYFQYTRSEGWSLEEGIVKTGSFSIDQGVGVRAVSGEKTAFAYSDDISEASLLDAARTVRSIASVAKSARTKVGARKIAQSRSLYP